MALMLKKKTNESPEVFIPKSLHPLLKPINNVRLWDKNPRRNDEAAERLAELIRKNGFRKPIVVDQNGIIRAGNTAYKAAKLLGMHVIPVTVQEFQSEEAAVAFALSDNKASEYAEWDRTILGEILSVDNMEKAAQDTGFSEAELRRMFALPDTEQIEKINSEESGLKGQVIILVMDAVKIGEVRSLLNTWIATTGLMGIEVR